MTPQKFGVRGIPTLMLFKDGNLLDVTHSVQKPNQTSGVTGGDPSLIEAISLNAAATGADGLFIETHPNPSKAKSDPHTMLELDELYPILKKVVKIKSALTI